MSWEAFFQIHRGLDREGPGTPDDVHWALDQIAPPARIFDAACGPGADTHTLAAALPQAQIVAIDKQAQFIADTQTRCVGFGARVTARTGDMFEASGPFNLIWCAGAVYFAGVRESLTRFGAMLVPDGTIAFSEPIAPGKAAPKAAHDFWQDYPALTDAAGIAEHIRAAGFTSVGTRLIKGAAWQNYYDPMQARITLLRASDPDPELTAALDENQREIDLWRAAPDHIAYQLNVVQRDAG